MVYNFQSRIKELIRTTYYTPKIIQFFLHYGVYAGSILTADYLKKKREIPNDIYSFIMFFQGLQFFAAPFWSGIADRFKCHKLMMIFLSFACMIFYGLLLVDIPLVEYNHYIYYGFMYTIFTLFVSGLFPILDYLVLALLESKGFSRKEYGKQKLWGTIGHALSLVVSGKFVEMAKSCEWENFYIPMFINTFVSLAFFMASVYILLPKNIIELQNNTDLSIEKSHQLTVKSTNALQSGPSNEASAKSHRFWKACKILFSNWQFIFLLLFILINGLGRAVPHTFISLIIDKKMSIPHDEKSYLVSFRIFSEIIMLFYGKALLDRIGPYWMILIAQLANASRNLGYYLIPPEYSYRHIVLLLESLKGISSASLMTSAVQLCSVFAPPEIASVGQSLFAGVYGGLGVSLAGILGYFLKGDLELVFKVTAYSSFAALFSFFLKYAFYDNVLGFKRKAHF